MDGWMDVRVVRRAGGRTDRQTDRQIDREIGRKTEINR